MKITCAWCGKDIGEKDGEGVNGVSHGICEECLTKIEVRAKGESGTESTQEARDD